MGLSQNKKHRGGYRNNRYLVWGKTRHQVLRWMSFLLAGTLISVLFACALNPQKIEGVYIPGTYKGTGEGMRDDILVETKFSADRILGVKVVAHNDTANISDAAVEKIPDAIVTAQNSDVDAVSGATETSNGIKSAVESTIRQALRK